MDTEDNQDQLGTNSFRRTRRRAYQTPEAANANFTATQTITSLPESNTERLQAANKIVNRLEFDLSNKGYLRKAELMVLDMLASNNWERPIYFAITVGRSSYLNLEKYFQLEGLAYRIVPIENNSNRQIGSLEEDLMFDNMMNKFVWGGIDNQT